RRWRRSESRTARRTGPRAPSPRWRSGASPPCRRDSCPNRGNSAAGKRSRIPPCCASRGRDRRRDTFPPASMPRPRGRRSRTRAATRAAAAPEDAAASPAGRLPRPSRDRPRRLPHPPPSEPLVGVGVGRRELGDHALHVVLTTGLFGLDERRDTAAERVDLGLLFQFVELGELGLDGGDLLRLLLIGELGVGL